MPEDPAVTRGTNLVAAVTGHRPYQLLGGYDEDTPAGKIIKQSIALAVSELHAAGHRRFILGMALGVDTWAFEAALKLREVDPSVRLLAAVPFIGQPALWPEQAKRRWLSLCLAADHRHLVDENRLVSAGEFAALAALPYPKMERYSASKLLNQRNHWMIDRCDTLLTVWNGQPSGGTYAAITYGLEKGKSLLRLNPVDYSRVFQDSGAGGLNAAQNVGGLNAAKNVGGPNGVGGEAK